ncbi:Paternally expressed 10 [Rhizoctonia solani]|uniref:Paternally expressed 10 n=1 Tax=Rhizoctonia solani TaxID=456999 RepID=A0A8H7I4T8_9AGAM|nr:Paternally expressed 10 [Rhizoctonia solani]
MRWQPVPEHRLSPSPLDQGELGPALPATADEPRSLEPEVYGEISLSRAISLLLGLQNQVLRLERELEELKEVNKEARDWMGAVDQTLTRIEAIGGPNPTHQKTGNPRHAPLIAWANPTKPPITFAQPTPVRAPPRVPTPTPPAPIRLQSPLASQPAAPVVAYQAPVKTMAHQDDGMGPPQSADVPNRSGGIVLPPDEHEGHGRSLGTPHLDQLGSHRAIIQTVKDFRREFLTAFGNPDATRAAERQITNLTQTGTCAEYITKFRTIAMDLDWNDAALCGQFARGLHWEVSQRASHPPKGNKSGTSNTTPNRGASTGQQATRPGRLSSDPNFVSEEERNRRRAEGLCIKCGKRDTSLRNAALAGRPRLRRKARHLVILTPPYRGITPPPTYRSPFTPHRYYARWSSPQAGKIWKKAVLTFTYDGKRMTETFLICNTGSHAAILGLKWLDAHNPEIDWNTRTLSFPHTLPEHVAIAEEEEADQRPLEGVPSKYHQYAKVFGEEEFNKLPPTDITI